jgi:TonB family protein
VKQGGVLVLVLFAALQGASVRGQEPLTPGRLALMAADEQGGVPVEALRRGLTDGRADVRAVAARIVGLTLRQSLFKDLAAALERENDGAAATEQVRAVLYLQGNAAIPVARAAAERLLGEPLLAFAEWLARSYTAQFVAASDLFRKAGESRPALAGLAAMAANSFPDERARLTETVATFAPGPSWRNYLTTVNWNSSEALAIRVGVGADDAEVREQTVWWALEWMTQNTREVPGDLAAQLTASAPGDTSWTTVGRELLSRRINKQRNQDLETTIAAAGAEHRSDLGRVAASDLTSAERAAVEKVEPALAERKAPAAAKAEAPRRVSSLRMIDPLVPGLMADMFATAQCSYGDGTVFGAARLTYHGDGRPKDVGIDAALMKPPCARVLRALALLSIAGRDEPVLPDTFQWLYVPIEKNVVSCIDAPAPPEGPPARVGGKITPPRKTRNVNPSYPASLQKAGVQGLVILESIISETGCVKRAKVIRSVHPGMDMAAMNAVSQWRFTPTRLGDRVVPVIMTVTVNFTLQ